MFIKCISTDVVQMKKPDRENKIMLFGLNKLGKLKDDATDFTRHTKEFVDDTANSIFKKKEDFPKKGYDESLEYIRLNRKTKIEFPADESSKDKLSKLLSPDVVGSAGGLIGAAATVGVIGTTLGTGLIVAGAGALLGDLIAKNSNDVEWIPAELFLWDDELVISGKYSIGFDEIKLVISSPGEILTLTLKDEAIQFRTYNSKALKTVINEKIDNFYKK